MDRVPENRVLEVVYKIKLLVKPCRTCLSTIKTDLGFAIRH